MDAATVTKELWGNLGGATEALDRLRVDGPADIVPSVFPVTTAATACVAAASLAVAELWAGRGGPRGDVRVDTRDAAAAFASDQAVRRLDDPLPPIWDDLAGDYRTADGWIRLHTNFRAHRGAALSVLGVPAEREAVAQAVASWSATALEDAIDAAGGCAAALRSLAEWRGSRPGRAVAFTPLLAVDTLEEAPAVPLPARPGRPLDGVRVLDLTRVVAGPVCGRFLAAYGADVLRIDGPAAEDVPALVADTTVGKRSAVLDLRAPTDRAVFERLLAEADAVLQAYRPGALDQLGYGPDALAVLRPGVVVASLSAYGGVGPWRNRRGFDSLVQFATGIADEGRAATGVDAPVPLPVQALDHATGYLLAAGVATALHRRTTGGGAWHVRASLARTAHWLDGLGRTEPSGAAPAPPADDTMVELDGPLGRTLHVRPPGSLDGCSPTWLAPPRPLGHDAPAWAPAH